MICLTWAEAFCFIQTLMEFEKMVAFGTRKSNQFAPEGTQVSSPYSGFDEAFQKDLWTASSFGPLGLQLVKLSNSFHTSEPHMVNIVTRNGYSPDDIFTS